MQLASSIQSNPVQFSAEPEDLTDAQLAILKKRLDSELVELLQRISQTEDVSNEHLADVSDRATLEEERAIRATATLRLSNRIKDVRSALRKIDEGDYGYCEDTGEPIGFERLMANPSCRLSFFAQERRERERRA